MKKRELAKVIVIRVFCNKYGLPPSYFKEKDTLKKWKIQSPDLDEIAYDINTDNSHGVFVTPEEIGKQETIGAVIDLVAGRLKTPGKKPRR